MFAYIDGTTGGMMLQIFGGGVVGLIFLFKYLGRSFFSSLFHRKRKRDLQAVETAAVSNQADPQDLRAGP